jgi:hypothetical protein
MDFPQKVFNGVFENAIKKSQKLKKKITYLIYHLPDIRRFHFFFSFGAPRLPARLGFGFGFY